MALGGTRIIYGFFGLHPALRPLLPAWQAQHLAVVHACGAPDESRSHFRAMELMERGVWDTHFAQGGRTGPMANLLRELAEGVAAFHADLADHIDRLTVVTMTEFGRRASENGSLGTDHGPGGLMLLLGGNVLGGQVHGRWPCLAKDRLVGPGDLAITTDYRDVLGELCLKRLNNPALDRIFPGYTVTTQDILI